MRPTRHKRRGRAYRCSFRVTEAVHAIEPPPTLAQKLNMDPAELRMKNFIKPEQFPYKSVLGWEYDSGNYGVALRESVDIIRLRRFAREAWPRSARRGAMGKGFRASPKSSAPARRGLRHSRHQDVRLGRRSASTRPARRSRASAPRARDRSRDDLRADRSPRAGIPRRTFSRLEGRATPHRAVRSGHLREPSTRPRARLRTRLAQDPRQGKENRGALLK